MHVVSIFTLVLQSTNTCHSVCVIPKAIFSLRKKQKIITIIIKVNNFQCIKYKYNFRDFFIPDIQLFILPKKSIWICNEQNMY